MSGAYLSLTYWQVALAAALIVLNAGLSLALKLRLERDLFVASLRTTAQLFLLGFVLQWIFTTNRWYFVVCLLVLITLIAGQTASKRASKKYEGMVMGGILSIWASSWLVAGYADLVIFRAQPWYSPPLLIPLVGMILGNSLNGISLALDRLGEELSSRRELVEARLALGADRWEAAQPVLRSAIRTGMIPMINAMMVAGVVSLPGMMTGQLLSGISPVEAVKYQVILMFLIASTTLLGTIGVVLLGFRRLFSARHQFRYRALSGSSG